MPTVHDPFSPHDAPSTAPAKKGRSKKTAAAKPTDVQPASAEQMVVDPTAAKTAPAKKAASKRTTGAKKAAGRRGTKSAARGGRRG